MSAKTFYGGKTYTSRFTKRYGTEIEIRAIPDGNVSEESDILSDNDEEAGPSCIQNTSQFKVKSIPQFSDNDSDDDYIPMRIKNYKSDSESEESEIEESVLSRETEISIIEVETKEDSEENKESTEENKEDSGENEDTVENEEDTGKGEVVDFVRESQKVKVKTALKEVVEKGKAKGMVSKLGKAKAKTTKRGESVKKGSKGKVKAKTSGKEKKKKDGKRKEKGKKSKKDNIIWKKVNMKATVKKELAFEGEVAAHLMVDEEPPDPIEYFQRFIDDELLELIVQESNKYSVQENPNKPLKLTRSELEQFLGILFAMSLVKMPSTRMYWGREFYFDKIAPIMTVNRFETIKRFLHCNDNASRPKGCTDRLYKIRPIIELLRAKFIEITPNEDLCIDEQMVPFKGKSSLKQYNPMKPKKWGYKFYVLSGVDGIVHNFQMHTGAIQVCPNQPDLKPSANIVLILLQHITRDVWHKLYIDNWYTGLGLVKTLYEQGIACVGTVRSNRLSNCSLTSDKEMKKKGRGTMEMWTTVIDNVELRVVKWFDNRGVTLLTTYESAYPTKVVNRWDRKNKQVVDVECPSIVTTYNRFMGGVDLLDSLLSLYRIPLRSKKWYHRLIFHFFDLVVVQSWLLYRRDMNGRKHRQLRDFKASIAESLLRAGKSNHCKRGRPSYLDIEHQLNEKKRKGPTAHVPNKSIRLDGLHHWPTYMPEDMKGRCKYPECKSITRVKCEKCQLNLCFTSKSNCFKDFHTM